MFGRQGYAKLHERLLEVEVHLKQLEKEWQGAETRFNALYARLARKAREAARQAEQSLEDAPKPTNEDAPKVRDGGRPLITNPAALALLRGDSVLLPR